MDHTIIKEAATKIVANIKAMEDDITVLQNKQDIISTSDATMTGSYPGRVSIEEIGGKCEQASTTGAQLFDVRAVKAGALNNDTGVLEEGTLAISNPIYLTSESTYTITHDLPNGVRVFFYDAEENHLSNSIYAKGVWSFTTPKNTSYIRLKSSQAHFGTNLMLNAGSTELPYEPYTGGIPSPNPDYPQEIKKTVVSEIKTHGKNFVEIDAVSKIESGITFTVNNNGSVTLKGTSTDTIYFILKSNFTVPANTIMSGCPSGGSVESYLLAATFHEHYTKHDFGSGILLHDTEMSCRNFYIQVMSGVTVDTTFYPMIRKADVEDDTYEPYTESTITLSQPVELYGIGDVRDAIEDGGVVRRFEKIVLDGSEDEVWQYEAASKRMLTDLLVRSIKRPSYNDKKIYLLCSCLQNKTANETYTGEVGISVQYDNGRVYMYLGNDMTLDDWKARLANNPMTVIYELATPTTEDLPLVDQIALNSLSTYDGITYLEFDSEIEPTFQGEYGVSKIGGYALEGVLAGVNGVSLGQSNTDRITALEATLVNNI